MRLLHTADWHLGDRLGRIDRTEDLRKAVEQVAAYCQQEQVDVLLVAGDLFSELVRPDSWRQHVEHLERTFRPFLQAGGTIIALTGNHDNENLCDTLAQAMELVEPMASDKQPASLARRGRFYLATKPTFLRLQDPQGLIVQFVLMPYPRPSHYPEIQQRHRACHSPEERNSLLAECWGRQVDRFCRCDDFDRDQPAILGGHIQMFGANIDTGLFRLRVVDDVVVSRAAWVDRFDYIALGHIHKPQILHEHPPICYSGSIERLDIGEKDDAKSAVLVDIGPDGLRAPPRLLPLDATPMQEIIIADPDTDLPQLHSRFPPEWRERALVKLEIRYKAGQHILDELLRQTAALFPRWYDRHWQEVDELAPLSPQGSGIHDHTRSVAQIVRSYLEEVLADRPAEERDALLAMVEDLLRETEAADRPPESTGLFSSSTDSTE